MEHTILGKIDFLKLRPLKTEEVEIPEWGGSFIVQEMTGTQRDNFETYMLSLQSDESSSNHKGIRTAIIINTVVDQSGKPLFSDLDAADISKKSAAILDKIAGVGLKLSGMKAAVIEEAVKN